MRLVEMADFEVEASMILKRKISVTFSDILHLKYTLNIYMIIPRFLIEQKKQLCE